MYKVSLRSHASQNATCALVECIENLHDIKIHKTISLPYCCRVNVACKERVLALFKYDNLVGLCAVTWVLLKCH